MALVASIENSLIEQSHKGGLGILVRDLFLEARENGKEAMFFSMNFQKEKIQELKEGKIEEVLKSSSNENLKFVESFEVQTKWYPCEVKLFEHGISTKNTKAYFVTLENYESWIKDLCIYGENNQGEELYVRYVFGKAICEWLRKNGIEPKVYHLNESDTALVALQLLDDSRQEKKIIFHSHTPEPWGHKKYLEWLVRSLVEEREYEKLSEGRVGNVIDFGKFLAKVARKIMCVSKKHAEITREKIYPEFCDKIENVTNGISKSWIDEELKNFYDKKVKGWESNVELLEKLKGVSDEEIIEIKERQRMKFNEGMKNLIGNGKAIGNFEEEKLSLIYAKRLTEYKRPESVLTLLDLKANLIVAGMPVDYHGKEFLKEILEMIKKGYSLVYVLNYNPETAKVLLNGYAWLNVPYPAREASGTSFMKSLVNGMILITTNAGSVPEFVVDNYNGLLVDDDLSNLKERVKEALGIYEDKRKYARIVKNSLSSYRVLMPRMFKEIESCWGI
jgi:starch phosphorylase